MLFFFIFLILNTSCSSDEELSAEIIGDTIIENQNPDNKSSQDWSPKLQAILDKGGLIKLNKMIYTINAPLNLNVSGTILDLNGATITSKNIFRLLNINQKSIEDNFNFTIKNGNFSSTFDNSTSQRDLFGLITIDNKDVDKGNFENLYFTNPKSSTNAIKVIASINGTEIKKLYFMNITVENCGQMALEINAHNNAFNTVNYVENVFIEEFNAKNLGTKSKYGMGVSISGNVHNTEWNGGIIDGFKDRGIENAGGRIFKVSNVKILNPIGSEDEFIGVSDGAGQGNKNYSSNVRTIFDRMYIEGDGVINLNSDEKDILVSNSTFIGNIKFDNRNVEYVNNKIKTSNLFQSFQGKHVSINGGTIDFGKGISRFSVGGGTISVENAKITKEDDGILIDVSNISIFHAKNTEFTNGYINTQKGSIINLDNVKYSSGLGGTPFRGEGTYTQKNVTKNL